MTLTKINYEIVGRFNYGRQYGVMSKETVEGYQIDQYAAVRKHEDWKTCQWTVDSWQTGIAITTTGSATRKAAVEAYEQMKEKIAYILDDPKRMEVMMKQKEDAIPETTLAAYEELDLVILNNHRLDKLTIAAKNSGCIVKEVKEESYLHGGHIKVYGTAEMLKAVKTLIEKFNQVDADYAAAAKKEAEKQEGENMNKEVKQEEKQVQEAKQAATETETTTEATTTETEKQASPAADEIDISALTTENLADYLPALLMSLANDKHNSSIILAAGIEAGAIQPVALLDYFQTGRMPAVHTFDVWKKAGYSVKKGEVHAFAARIWKYTEKKAGTYTEEEAAAINSMVVNADGSDMVQAGDEKTSHDFIKKTSFFFTAAQVEKTPEPAPLPELPADVKKETRGSCTWISGNTRPIKEALKAAGFRWSKKNTAWYRREAA